MKIFPHKKLKFKLHDSQEESLERLTRRTEVSKNLTSQHTDKSFRGIIDEQKFKIISSAIGIGAFCIMTGSIERENGYVSVEIHKVFKSLLSIFLVFPIIALAAISFNGSEGFSPLLILVTFGQILVIRFIFIEIAFRLLSKQSLNRLRDVIDFEWV